MISGYTEDTTSMLLSTNPSISSEPVQRPSLVTERRVPWVMSVDLALSGFLQRRLNREYGKEESLVVDVRLSERRGFFNPKTLRKAIQKSRLKNV